jgi:hypothetical protein
MGIYAAEVLHDPDFELNRFIIRSVYLSVIAMLLGYLGAHNQRLHAELSRLVAWPAAVPRQAKALVQELLEHTSRILGVTRLLIVWEEPEEPWIHVALWASGTCIWTREPAGTFQPLINKHLTLMLDSRVLCDQQFNERMKQRFASLSGVVHKLEKTEVKGEFFL